MIRIVLQILIVLLLGYSFICALAFFLQHKLIYFPGPETAVTPRSMQLDFEEVMLTPSDGVQLHAWYLPLPNASSTVMVCHGNAGNITERLPLAQSFLDMGHSVLLFDYRGFGKSTGRPTEEGTYRDAESAFDYLRDKNGVRDNRIVVVGESLGAAVAIELARRRDVAALVLENAFASIADAGAHRYPFLPTRLVVRIHYDNVAKIGALEIPVMVIHSRDDRTTPFSQGQKLYEAATPPKEFLETDGEHSEGGFRRREEWRDRVRDFIDRAVDG